MSTWPNTPAGATVLLDHDFSTKAPLLDVYNTGILDTDATDPVSPSSVLRSHLNAGSHSGGIQLEYNLGTAYTDLFVGLAWRTNAGFEGRPQGNKLFFMRGSGSNGVFLFSNQSLSGGTGPMLFGPNTSGLDNSHLTGSTDPGTQLYPNMTAGTLTRGVWHRLEAYIRKSTTNTSRDGIVRWWINGTLVGNYTNVNYAGGGLNNWTWAETWDGTPNFTASVDWDHYLGHVYLATGGTPSSGGTTVPVLQTLSPSTATIAPGNTQTYTVGMSAPVTSNTVVAVSSSNTSVATVPTSVTVASGQASGTFAATGVAAGTSTLTASLSGNSATAVVTVASAGGGGTTTSSNTYTYSAQFSGTQGQDGWSYRDTAGTLLSYNAGTAVWGGTYPLSIWSSGFHPGSTNGAVVRWTTPSTGSAAISGSVKDYDTTFGDGVTFSVVYNNTTTLYTKTLSGADATEYTYNVTQAMTVGDFIDFIVTKNSGIDYDSTLLNPVIVLTVTTATNPNAPTISSFTPASGTLGSSVTIIGTNFNATPANNTVTFNGVPAAITSASTTQLVATVPALATTGAIAVTTSNGTVTSTTNYTVTNPGTPTTPPATNYGGNAFLLLVLP